MENPILRLIRYVKKHGWEKAKKEWKRQYLLLETPEQLLKKEIIGYTGALFGMTIAIIVLLMRGTWYLTIAMVFVTFIMWTQLKGRLKQKQLLKDIKENFNDIKMPDNDEDKLTGVN